MGPIVGPTEMGLPSRYPGFLAVNIALLAGSVAHDFNHQLTAIMGYGGLVRRRLAEPGSQLGLSQA